MTNCQKIAIGKAGIKYLNFFAGELMKGITEQGKKVKK